MHNYIQLHFKNLESAWQEILIAQLADTGFSGFEQGPAFLNAFIEEHLYDEAILKDIPGIGDRSCTVEVIAPKNWNEEWEKSFEPVIIDDFCAIRASFHPLVAGVKHEIIITPKMSFGTGHHATTFQVIQLMATLNFENKNVLDFGTGTGVLAILAEKLNAQSILAIDHDEWSINNAGENVQINNCKKITLLNTNKLLTDKIFDIVLANVNKDIILENLPSFAKHLQQSGVLILSGLLEKDRLEIADAALNERLLVIKHSQKHDWIALTLINVKSAQNCHPN